MVTRQKNVFSCAANFSRGKKCIFCGSFKTKRTARGYVRCRKKTRKGSVYFTDRFRSYNSLKRWGKHHRVNHSKNLVDRKTQNHINGIEGFWSYTKHVLYNYRGISKYHFPMYLKEVEYRFNHRRDNLFKLFINIYFGYDSH